MESLRPPPWAAPPPGAILHPIPLPWKLSRHVLKRLHRFTKQAHANEAISRVAGRHRPREVTAARAESVYVDCTFA